MNEESKELMTKVVDYTSKDKEIIIEQTQKYSAIAAISLLAGIIFAAFDITNQFYQITDVLFGVALIYTIAAFLLTNGKASEMRKNKAKAKKYFVLLLAGLVAVVVLVFALIGLIR